MAASGELDGLVGRIVAAGAKVVDPYFNLPVAESPDSFLRERVYAYELYHQLRCQPDAGVALTAEPDKRGHPLITDDSNPDFVFHIPGGMSDNLAVLEVKQATSTKVQGDLEKFRRYLSGWKYQHCLWLVFGPLDDAVFSKRFVDPFKEFAARGRLLWHRSSGAAPKVIR